MFLDIRFLIFITLPSLLLATITSMYTKSTFLRYEKVASRQRITGAEAARLMLNNLGIYDVKIEQVGGFLSDHYDPTRRVLRLSNKVYNSYSLAAIGVACHEAGHAIQHAKKFIFLGLRTTLVPLAGFGSHLSYIIIMAGFFMHNSMFIKIGALLFSFVVLFAIITLPVEWDASRRAKKQMVRAGIVDVQEAKSAGRVLNAAFLTYLASAMTAVMTLLYYLFRAGLLGGSDD